jgi:hypothetical protein
LTPCPQLHHLHIQTINFCSWKLACTVNSSELHLHNYRELLQTYNLSWGMTWELGYINYRFNKISPTREMRRPNPKIHRKKWQADRTIVTVTDIWSDLQQLKRRGAQEKIPVVEGSYISLRKRQPRTEMFNICSCPQ